MSKATDFNDTDSLNYPTNRVLAIIDEPARAREAVDALHAGGFAPEEIGLLDESQHAGKFDAASGQEGTGAQVAAVGPGFGDRDSDYMQEYRQALAQGRAVVTVVARNDQERDQITEALRQKGGHFIHYFGPLSVQKLHI